MAGEGGLDLTGLSAIDARLRRDLAADLYKCVIGRTWTGYAINSIFNPVPILYHIILLCLSNRYVIKISI